MTFPESVHYSFSQYLSYALERLFGNIGFEVVVTAFELSSLTSEEAERLAKKTCDNFFSGAFDCTICLFPSTFFYSFLSEKLNRDAYAELAENTSNLVKIVSDEASSFTETTNLTYFKLSPQEPAALNAYFSIFSEAISRLFLIADGKGRSFYIQDSPQMPQMADFAKALEAACLMKKLDEEAADVIIKAYSASSDFSECDPEKLYFYFADEKVYGDLTGDFIYPVEILPNGYVLYTEQAKRLLPELTALPAAKNLAKFVLYRLKKNRSDS